MEASCFALFAVAVVAALMLWKEDIEVMKEGHCSWDARWRDGSKALNELKEAFGVLSSELANLALVLGATGQKGAPGAKTESAMLGERTPR